MNTCACAVIVIVMATAGLGSQSAPQGQPAASSTAWTCIDFASDGPLKPGTAFQYPLPGGLQFRLTPEENPALTQWYLSVVPQEGTPDFLWIASPPWQTAPQLAVGATYGLNLRESLATGRSLQFVLNASDYAEALALHDRVSKQQSDEVMNQILALGKGRLYFHVTGYEARKKPDGSDSNLLDSVEFRAVVCVPN
jgi:hypothetical protein